MVLNPTVQATQRRIGQYCLRGDQRSRRQQKESKRMVIESASKMEMQQRRQPPRQSAARTGQSCEIAKRTERHACAIRRQRGEEQDSGYGEQPSSSAQQQVE